MAEESVLINIQANIVERQKEVDSLRVAIEKLRQEQAAELKQAKESGATSEDLAKLKVQQKKSVEELNTQLKANNKELQMLQRVEKSETGSIENLRAQLALVEKQWAENYKALGENSEETEALAAEKLRLTEVLKKEEKATGDTRRNVGNYSEGVKEALNETGLFSRELGYLQKAQKVATIATAGTTGAMKLLRVALMSTGVGALLVAFGSLVSYFSSTEEGVLKLQKILAPFRVLLGNLSDILSAFGEGLVNLFSGRFSAAQDSFNRGWELTKGLITETTDETEQYIKMLDAQLALTQKEREAKVQLAKLETEVAVYKLKAKDKENATDTERLNALDIAIAKEREMLSIQEDLASERLRLIELSQTFSNTSGEELDQRAEAEAELIRLRKTTADRLRELEEQRRTVIRETAAVEKAAVTARQKLEDDAMKELEKQIEDELKLVEASEERKILAAMNQTKAVVAANQAMRDQIFSISQSLEENDLVRLENERLRRVAEIEATIADEQLKQDAILLINEQSAKQMETIEQAKRNTMLQGLSGTLATAKGLFEENTGAYKAIASAEALINTYLSASKAYTSLAAFPPLAIAAAAAAVAAGLKNVAQINNVKFAKGGILSGASHAQGGIQLYGSGGYYGEAEGGEVILTKNVSRNPSLLRAASNINQAAGGRGFYATGGVLPQQAMINSIDRNIQKVYVPAVVVQDVTEIQGLMRKVEAMAIE